MFFTKRILMIACWVLFVCHSLYAIADDKPISHENNIDFEYNEFGLPYLNLLNKPRSTDESVSIIAVGDMRITSNETVKNLKSSLSTVIGSRFLRWMSSKDIVVGNLEMTFLENLPDGSNCMIQTDTGQSQWIEYFKVMNFKALNVANNHFQFDADTCGIKHSLFILETNDIQAVGIGNNFGIIEKRNVRIGMIGLAKYTMNSSIADKNYKIGDILSDDPSAQIKAHKQKVDHLIVFTHWGETLFNMPSPQEEELAKKFLSNGASFIIGSGPHVLQRIDTHENGVVAFSLGNFVFNKLPAKANLLAMQTCMLELVVVKNEIVLVNVYPVITDGGTIRIPNRSELESFKSFFKKLYAFNPNDYYKEYSLFKRIRGRLKLIWTDIQNDPIKAIQNNFKLRYVKRVFRVIYAKYNHLAFYVIIGIIICSAFIVVYRKKYYSKVRLKHQRMQVSKS